MTTWRTGRDRSGIRKVMLNSVVVSIVLTGVSLWVWTDLAWSEPEKAAQGTIAPGETADSEAPPVPRSASTSSPGREVTLAVTPDYIIGPEDKLEVSVWRNKDLSKVVEVRPDGRISLPLIGDVMAEGSTPEELTAKIAIRLKAYMENPTVAIVVAEVRSYAVFIMGAVKDPGKKPLKSKTSLLQMITIAGGFAEAAARNKIIVFRLGTNGEQGKIKASYDDIVLRGKSEQNILLRPGDTIVVPSQNMVLIP